MRVVFAFLQMALDVLDDDDGVVHDQTGGQRNAEQSQRVDGEAEELDEGERSDQRDRDGDRGDDGRAPVLEEKENDEDYEDDGLAQGRDDVADGFRDGVGRVEGQLIFHARREALGEAVEFGDAAAIHVEGVGGRELSDADADRFVPVVVEVGAVVLGAKFGMAHVAQADERAVVIAFQDDVVELGGLGETADGANADLKLLAGNGGLGTDLSGGDFDVLLLEGVDCVVRGQAASRHAHGIEPETHRVLALAEDEDFGYAGNAFQAIAHIHVEVVAHEEWGVAAVGRKDSGAKHEVLRTLLHRDTDLLDRVGQASQGGVDPVLDVHGSEVGVAGEIEGRRDLAEAIVAAGGSDVLHALGAVDLLLERRGDRRFHRLRAGPGIDAGDADLRRREIGELRDGQCGNDDRARQNDEQGADRRENRAMDEEINHKNQ